MLNFFFDFCKQSLHRMVSMDNFTKAGFKRIALIQKSQPSEWVSCRSISTNLQNAYFLTKTQHSDRKVESFYVDESSSIYQLLCVASKIQDWNADLLVFIDHTPCPALILRALFHLNKSYKPEVIVHVFGDFTLNVNAWLAAQAELKNYSMNFTCASDKQALLLKKFISDEKTISVAAFPINEKEYFFDQSLRDKTRNEFNFKPDDSIFIYSGRLSLQKNVLSLLRSFSFYQEHVNSKAILFLAGPIDDLGNPYLGKQGLSGLMAFDLQNSIHDLFKNSKKSIHYLGNLQIQQLNAICNAADAYISLSTHNDEDYGMAPAEALMTGCPVILSDWGGFSSFKKIAGNQCQLIPVKVGTKSVYPDHSEVVKGLLNLPMLFGKENRSEFAIMMRNQLGINNFPAENLITQDRFKFNEFSSLFKRIGQSFSMNPLAPFSTGKEYSKLYRETYDVY